MQNIALIIAGLFSFATKTIASDYPQTNLEQEIKKLGSLVGSESIILRPEQEKSKETQAKIGNVNKYLYKAAIDVLNFAPLASADRYAGTITTK